VFCESAIDALSHAVLFPDNGARYASIGGKTNPQQPELIRAAVARMPADSEVIAAMDADAEGRKLVETVRRSVELTGCKDLRFTVQEAHGVKDWNDQLRQKPHPSFPTAWRFPPWHDFPMPPDTGYAEKHYTPRELPELWRFDESAVRRMFIDEPGVLVYSKEKRRDGRRDYVTLRIPESVARRVYERRTRRTI
jgi:hypothetical protein